MHNSENVSKLACKKVTAKPPAKVAGQRPFQQAWLTQYKWLQKDDDGMHCSVCISHEDLVVEAAIEDGQKANARKCTDKRLRITAALQRCEGMHRDTVLYQFLKKQKHGMARKTPLGRRH